MYASCWFRPRYPKDDVIEDVSELWLIELLLAFVAPAHPSVASPNSPALRLHLFHDCAASAPVWHAQAS